MTFLIAVIISGLFLGVVKLWVIPKRKFFQTGNLATTLERYLKIDDSTKRVQVVGYDDQMLDSKKYRAWVDLLKTWDNKGIRCDLYFHKTSYLDKNPDILKELPTNLKVYEVKSNEKTKDYLERTVTTHFLIVDSPNQLWLEGNHRIGETSAENCELLQNASNDKRWETIQAVLGVFSTEENRVAKNAK